MAERVKAVNVALALVKQPVTAADVAKGFARVRELRMWKRYWKRFAPWATRGGARGGTFLP